MCVVVLSGRSRLLCKFASSTVADSVNSTLMRATLALLALFELAQSAQLYFHPPISIWGRLPRHLTSATVAKHLHLDRLAPLQENGPLYTGDIDRPFVGEGSSSSLLIAVDDADAECKLTTIA
jgi:hypothetical protein